MLGFNDMSTLVGHFVLSPRERRKDIEEIIEEMKERDREEESKGTEEIKAFPLYPYLLQGQQALPNCKPISVGRPGDKSYRTPSPHPTSLNITGTFLDIETYMLPVHFWLVSSGWFSHQLSFFSKDMG